MSDKSGWERAQEIAQQATDDARGEFDRKKAEWRQKGYETSLRIHGVETPVVEEPPRNSRLKSDNEWLLEILSDGKPHTLNEIIKRSFEERGCGITVHSRAADLRCAGHDVVNKQTKAKRGDGSIYRLIPPSKPTPEGASFEDVGLDEVPDGEKPEAN